jgi:hypothetical protein
MTGRHITFCKNGIPLGGKFHPLTHNATTRAQGRESSSSLLLAATMVAHKEASEGFEHVPLMEEIGDAMIKPLEHDLGE